ncbi:proline-rich transmembrane protein 1-like [Apostichopus japonicus]|uniref:proline-rich transmembrane protein 1-like n=1 Tax=Stichopus japonicus TaxID=307972 RepID=UPI003AB5F0A6
MENQNANEAKVHLIDNQEPYQDEPPQYDTEGSFPAQQVMIRQPPLTDPPRDYFAEAILVTICCFWPTGIVAIIKASEVQQAAARGDRDMAERSSVSARKFVCLTLGIGVACLVLVLLLCVLYAVFLINLLSEE